MLNPPPPVNLDGLHPTGYNRRRKHAAEAAGGGGANESLHSDGESS